ncbi:MAG: transcriptional regulator PpsR [Devosia sp.]
MDAATGPSSVIGAELAAFANLGPETVANLIGSASDVSLVLDDKGIIRDLAVTDRDTPRDAFEGWLGRPFVDTVSVESRMKVERLLSTAWTGEFCQPTHVNHPRTGAEDLPIRYSASRLSSERVVAIGRDLSPLAMAQRRLLLAQRNAEREYARLRSSEARYRQYFSLCDEPVLFVDVNDRVTESNKAASSLWAQHQRLTGRKMVDLVRAGDRAELAEAMAAARAAGAVRIVKVDPGRVVVAPLRHEKGALLLRFADAVQPLSPVDKLGRVVEAMPDAFVVTDENFTVLTANAAFVSLVEATNPEAVAGVALEHWLGRPGVDISVIRSALAETGVLRAFATVVQGELGHSADVEVSAARVVDSGAVYVGLSIRYGSVPESMLPPRSAQQLAELVGRVPMKEIVRETTDTIERMCIEAALELSGDNRASAAELLGLSRQSLYVKMRRYGIVDVDSADDAVTAS